MTDDEEELLSSRTPEEYIERSLASPLPPPAKAGVAKAWMARTGFTAADIRRARNRNPYWKARKAVRAAERSRRRLDENRFGEGGRTPWTPERLAEYATLDERDAEGRYILCDRRLAALFGTGIPSVQYLRRKRVAVERAFGHGVDPGLVARCMALPETLLRRGRDAIEAALREGARRATDSEGERFEA